MTVGSQLPFDRLIKAVDQWCGRLHRDDVIGQIGNPDRNGYTPSHFHWERMIPPARYHELFSSAELVIAHAGMGTIITAMTLSKPLLIMPRREHYGEHRNDHQFHSAQAFSAHSQLEVAMDEDELPQKIEAMIERRGLSTPKEIGAYADKRLISSIQSFIASTSRPTVTPEVNGHDPLAPSPKVK